MEYVVNRLANRSKKQEVFVFALVKNNGNVLQSCKDAGITEPTAYRWLSKEGLADDVKEVRQKLIENSLEVLQQATINAVKCVLGLIEDDGCPRGIKLNACKVVFENSIRLREQNEIINRLAVIEEKFSAQAYQVDGIRSGA